MVVSGHTGTLHDNPTTDPLGLVLRLVQDRGPLPDGSVGEGIAVIDQRDNRLDVLLVD